MPNGIGIINDNMLFIKVVVVVLDICVREK